MTKKLPVRILFEIGVLRCRSVDTGTLVSVYAEAERIRRRIPDENVALEDIVEEIMAQCRDAPGFAISLKPKGRSWVHSRLFTKQSGN